MAEWRTTKDGLRICSVEPAKTAYKILRILEEDRIPHGKVGEVWDALLSILGSIEITHSADMERNPNWPQ